MPERANVLSLNLMPANFTSGWLGHGEAAWHGEGIVTQGALPAREAFETAQALFTVEKRQLTYPVNVHTEVEGFLPDKIVQNPSGSFGLVRTDTQQLLGIVSAQYEIVGNEQLLRMAEFIREEVEMDSVVVLKQGARVAFTAKIRGAQANILPNDPVYGRIVGHLGHDGKSGCGAIFTNVRVVCSNTMAAAERSDTKVNIRHKTGANANFDKLITSIDCARRNFEADVQLMDQLANTEIEPADFRDYLEQVYAKQLSVPVKENGEERARTMSDLRVTPHLLRAYHSGFGARPGTLWGALNAVTEVETSTKRGNSKRKFYSANFGSGLDMSKRAMSVARDLVSV